MKPNLQFRTLLRSRRFVLLQYVFSLHRKYWLDGKHRFLLQKKERLEERWRNVGLKTKKKRPNCFLGAQNLFIVLEEREKKAVYTREVRMMVHLHIMHRIFFPQIVLSFWYIPFYSFANVLYVCRINKTIFDLSLESSPPFFYVILVKFWENVKSYEVKHVCVLRWMLSHEK